MARSSAPGFLISFLVLIAGLLLAFTVGRYPVNLNDLFAVIFAKLTGHTPNVPPAVENVIWQVRGPRIIAATLVGAALAVAGTAFQGLFRNPLVSPDILGASSGAALGAVLGIFVSLGVFAIQALAFAGGLLAVATVYAVGSAVRARDPVLVLVLAGLVVSLQDIVQELAERAQSGFLGGPINRWLAWWPKPENAVNQYDDPTLAAWAVVLVRK